MAERSIHGLAVLLVEDDVDSQEVMTEFLVGLGCEVRVAGSAAEARAHLASWLPDVILCDVTLPDEDGFAMVSGLRGDPRTAAVPAIAMTGRSDGAARGRATRAGFQKFVTKPFDLFALPAALTSAASTGVAPGGDENLARLVERRDLRALLGAINRQVPYRYSSILRIVDDSLESVWTYDREHPQTDTFPAEKLLRNSYCLNVASTGAPFSIDDALVDPRTVSHPSREAVRSYCGVPLFRSDGSLFGTLCHYDERPQRVEPGVVDALADVARDLAHALPAQHAATMRGA